MLLHQHQLGGAVRIHRRYAYLPVFIHLAILQARGDLGFVVVLVVVPGGVS